MTTKTVATENKSTPTKITTETTTRDKASSIPKEKNEKKNPTHTGYEVCGGVNIYKLKKREG